MKIVRTNRCTSAGTGFTIVEVIIVVVIIAIVATMAVPMFSSAADMQLQTAANMIAADMEYAKNLAITQQQSYSVVFDTVNNSFQVQDQAGTPVAHPINQSTTLVVAFGSDSRTSSVDIAGATFAAGVVTNSSITFDYLGTPYSGIGTDDMLTNGAITLQAGTFTATIAVEPITGYVTIQ